MGGAGGRGWYVGGAGGLDGGGPYSGVGGAGGPGGAGGRGWYVGGAGGLEGGGP